MTEFCQYENKLICLTTNSILKIAVLAFLFGIEMKIPERYWIELTRYGQIYACANIPSLHVSISISVKFG